MKKKILIIDDDLIYCKIVKKLLCSDYELIITNKSKQAISLLNSNVIPDLIITDFNLPCVKGFDFIKLLLSKVSLFKTPLIVVSGMEDGKLKIDLLNLGVKKYIIKPIERIYFKEIIDSLL